jgi:hypothetical protein
VARTKHSIRTGAGFEKRKEFCFDEAPLMQTQFRKGESVSPVAVHLQLLFSNWSSLCPLRSSGFSRQPQIKQDFVGTRICCAADLIKEHPEPSAESRSVQLKARAHATHRTHRTQGITNRLTRLCTFRCVRTGNCVGQIGCSSSGCNRLSERTGILLCLTSKTQGHRAEMN